MRDFPDGTRVRLLPFEDEPEQFGTVLGEPENGMYVVQIDPPLEDGDDGLREVSEDQMEREFKKS